jgi:saccharopine dehydrogenase-like NADP-dependent oxidoreductase
MRTIALIGAGKIGETIAALFAASGRYKVKVCDIDLKRADYVAQGKSSCEAHLVNLQDAVALKKLLADCEIVISALPFFCNKAVAQNLSRSSPKTHAPALCRNVASPPDLSV